jgi:hypothetical protein
MGATARAVEDQPDLEGSPRAKALGVTLMRPRRTTYERISSVPHEVLLLDEGIAVATYPDDGAVQYSTLDALLEDHGLSACDLEVVERVSGVGRWHR